MPDMRHSIRSIHPLNISTLENFSQIFLLIPPSAPILAFFCHPASLASILCFLFKSLYKSTQAPVVVRVNVPYIFLVEKKREVKKNGMRGIRSERFFSFVYVDVGINVENSFMVLQLAFRYQNELPFTYFAHDQGLPFSQKSNNPFKLVNNSKKLKNG